MSTIEQRLADLEAGFQEVQKLKGIPGPRGDKGNPGDIHAAVVNANQAVADAENRVQVKANAEFAKFSAEVKALRDEFRQLKEFINANIQAAVENHTVQVLRVYHLLDENHAPTHWKK